MDLDDRTVERSNALPQVADYPPAPVPALLARRAFEGLLVGLEDAVRLDEAMLSRQDVPGITGPFDILPPASKQR
jgi:hypothetical protein